MEVARDRPFLELLQQPPGLRGDVQLVERDDAAEVVERRILVTGNEQRSRAPRVGLAQPTPDVEDARVEIARAERHPRAGRSHAGDPAGVLEQLTRPLERRCIRKPQVQGAFGHVPSSRRRPGPLHHLSEDR